MSKKIKLNQITQELNTISNMFKNEQNLISK